MQVAAHDSQFAEILVECHQDLPVLGCVSQHVFVTRIGRPVTNPFDPVSGGAKGVESAAPHAGVKEYSHPPEDSVSAGSTRSCPTRRRA